MVAFTRDPVVPGEEGPLGAARKHSGAALTTFLAWPDMLTGLRSRVRPLVKSIVKRAKKRMAGT